MKKLSEYIIGEMQYYNISLNLVDVFIRDKIRKNIEINYINNNPKRDGLWENLIHFQCIQDVNGWHYIKNYIRDSECIMFFNEADDYEMILFKNGDDLDLTLAETYGYEFYITNIETTYLICFSNHDILYGCGNAEKWSIWGSMK